MGTIKLIIFIHGTLIPFPSFSSLMHTWKNKAAQGPFITRYFDAMRSKSIQQYQPIGELGLHPIDLSHGTYAARTARAYRSIEHATEDSNQGKGLQFYTFGWNGHLRQKARIQAAQELYAALLKEKAQLQNKHPEATIEITVIGHSHGGNVALRLAQVERAHQQELTIDELILLGMPVQKETMGSVTATMFKQIYHLYSTGDYVQVMDMFSTCGLSRRTFPLDLEKHLKQVKLDINKKQPNHATLWMLGEKSNILYQHRIPITPWPCAVFVPLIIKGAVQDDSPTCHASLQISGDKEVSLVVNGYLMNTPYINLDELTDMPV